MEEEKEEEGGFAEAATPRQKPITCFSAVEYDENELMAFILSYICSRVNVLLSYICSRVYVVRSRRVCVCVCVCGVVDPDPMLFLTACATH